MLAFHWKRFESVSGAAEQPSGGDVIISRKSDISRDVALDLLNGALLFIVAAGAADVAAGAAVEEDAAGAELVVVVVVVVAAEAGTDAMCRRRSQKL